MYAALHNRDRHLLSTLSQDGGQTPSQFTLYSLQCSPWLESTSCSISLSWKSHTATATAVKSTRRLGEMAPAETSTIYSAVRAPFCDPPHCFQPRILFSLRCNHHIFKFGFIFCHILSLRKVLYRVQSTYFIFCSHNLLRNCYCRQKVTQHLLSASKCRKDSQRKKTRCENEEFITRKKQNDFCD